MQGSALRGFYSQCGTVWFPVREYFVPKEGMAAVPLSLNITDSVTRTYIYWVATAIGVMRSLADLGSKLA